MYARYEPVQDTFLSSEPVIFRARSAVEQGIFMIGDASGIVDPLTGSGMAMAIQSALLAAPYILDQKVEAYRQRHDEFFTSRIRWSRRVAFLLSRPALLDIALTAHSLGGYLLRRTRAGRDEVERLADIELRG